MSKFIVFEGLDKAGKTSVINKLKKEFPDIVYTKEPGGLNDNTCIAINNLVKDKSLKIDPICEAYLYAANRSRHTYLMINDVDENKTIITDRFIQSSIVYQGMNRDISIDTIIDINKHALNDIGIDTIFYFKIDLETYLSRRGIPEDRIEENPVEFFKNSIENYNKLMDESSIDTNVVTIDATRPFDDVYEQVKQNLINILQ